MCPEDVQYLSHWLTSDLDEKFWIDADHAYRTELATVDAPSDLNLDGSDDGWLYLWWLVSRLSSDATVHVPSNFRAHYSVWIAMRKNSNKFGKMQYLKYVWNAMEWQTKGPRDS